MWAGPPIGVRPPPRTIPAGPLPLYEGSANNAASPFVSKTVPSGLEAVPSLFVPIVSVRSCPAIAFPPCDRFQAAFDHGRSRMPVARGRRFADEPVFLVRYLRLPATRV